MQAATISGPTSYNGHSYYLLSANTWTASQAEALTLGGNLVTINDAAEDAFVYSTFSTFGAVSRALWIGLFQPAGSPEPAGGFIWADGTPVSYTNWNGVGEPNNNTTNGPQNWTMIWPVGAPPGNNASKWNDYWNFTSTTDIPANFPLNGVVEIVPEPSSALLLLSGAALFLRRRPTRTLDRNAFQGTRR